ncbi:hypothetical protein HGRIS_012279 [Hohenbuehelia grisea]|uniref:Uncharacterized protein n=1 Tax=Hohenbuehelia grisea TaxID=104357 RepID=A0ABR3IRT1_9AGAR
MNHNNTLPPPPAGLSYRNICRPILTGLGAQPLGAAVSFIQALCQGSKPKHAVADAPAAPIRAKAASFTRASDLLFQAAVSPFPSQAFRAGYNWRRADDVFDFPVRRP